MADVSTNGAGNLRRKCAHDGCGTLLNSHNKADKCYVHIEEDRQRWLASHVFPDEEMECPQRCGYVGTWRGVRIHEGQTHGTNLSARKEGRTA